MSGEVRVSGAKNSALPLLFASVLSSHESRFKNLPALEDIDAVLELLSMLGSKYVWHKDTLRISTPMIASSKVSASLAKSMRASFWALGPILVRTGKAIVPLPGGDAIGSRPVDLHLQGLARLGADIRFSRGFVEARAPRGLRGAEVTLDFPSVGATHHLLMVMAGIAGRSVIRGAACEPEVDQLCDYLVSMGACIEGIGTADLVIDGVEELGAGVATIQGDRIEAATYLAAVAGAGGEVTVSGVDTRYLGAVHEVLELAGCKIARTSDSFHVKVDDRLRAVSFHTSPYPGVATDAQPLLMAALCGARGASSITENIFEHRLGHCADYGEFGVKIGTEGNRATVIGTAHLTGAVVDGRDIRAAAGLIILGLMAKGETIVRQIHHIHRGYENIVGKLAGLGVDICELREPSLQELVVGC